jgi:hypothetical protein
MPFFTFFLCLWQVSIFFIAKLLVDHAAVTAARSAAVIMSEPSQVVEPTPAGPGEFLDTSVGAMNLVTPARTALVTTAAELALAPLIADGTITSLAVSFPTTPGGTTFATVFAPRTLNNPITTMRVGVTTTMQCRIALASNILCKYGALTVSSEAVFPFQGATYQYQLHAIKLE